MHLTGWETVFFYVLGGWALGTGVFVVTARNAVHGALALVSALVAVAGMFVLLRAEFLAGVQVLVYVGGVMVLVLVVIMLVDVETEARERGRRYTKQAGVALAFVVLLAGAFVVAVNRARPAFAPSAERRVVEVATPGGVSRDTQEVGEVLYQRATLPFEIASILLLVAIVGAVVLGRERTVE